VNEKNSNLQYDLDEYHTQNQHLTENFTGLQAELLISQQNFEDQFIDYVEVSENFVELENENTELKSWLKILGLIHIAVRYRALNNF
jgi:hypothetical protein